jgi:hypothetical protein
LDIKHNALIQQNFIDLWHCARCSLCRELEVERYYLVRIEQWQTHTRQGVKGTIHGIEGDSLNQGVRKSLFSKWTFCSLIHSTL